MSGSSVEHGAGGAGVDRTPVDRSVGPAELGERTAKNESGTASDGNCDTGVGELVGRACDGDQGAWRELVERYSGRVFAMIQSRLRHRDESEELTQAVFVRVVDQFSRGKYREEGRFEPWLFRIAMNLVRDRVRRLSTGPRIVGGGDGEPFDSGQVSPGGRALGHARAERPEESVALRAAMDRLPEADREVLTLRHFGGLGFREIAESLGQPVGTLLARHHRAVAKLRAMLVSAEETAEEAGGQRTKEAAS